MGNAATTELCKAAIAGDLYKIKDLLSTGAQVNATDSDGNTALTLAIKNKRDNSIAEYLIEHDADVCKFLESDGQTPLSAAVETKNIPMISLLLENGADSTIQTAFRKAIDMGHFEIVKLLKEKGAIINVQYKDGYNSLTAATEMEHLRIVKFLVEQGANIDDFDGNGRCALSIAASKSSFQTVKFFIDSGANVSAAKKEVDNFAKCNEDFQFFLKQEATGKRQKGFRHKRLNGSGHEDCVKK